MKDHYFAEEQLKDGRKNTVHFDCFSARRLVMTGRLPATLDSMDASEVPAAVGSALPAAVPRPLQAAFAMPRTTPLAPAASLAASLVALSAAALVSAAPPLSMLFLTAHRSVPGRRRLRAQKL